VLTLPFQVGLFYGSSTCYTEIAAENICHCFASDGAASPVELHNIADTGVSGMADYHGLILGIPTWDYGELQEDWDRLWDEIETIDFQGKTVALYGLGDQVGYPDWFQDAMGYLYHKLEELGACIIGFWPCDGYTYNNSHAVTPDNKFFVGLALDDENESELSEARIQQWCQQIAEEFNSQTD